METGRSPGRRAKSMSLISKLMLVPLLLCTVMSLADDEIYPMPRVLILTTGGTIASRTDAPLIDGPALVQAVPELLDHAEVSVEEFSVIGSSKMTPALWLRLAKHINEVFADDADLAGIVITHGTDTMEETAYFLNLTVKSDRTRYPRTDPQTSSTPFALLPTSNPSARACSSS